VGVGQDCLTLEVEHAQAYEWHKNDIRVSIALDRHSEQHAQGLPKRNEQHKENEQEWQASRH
jgi:hypothetical protein